MTSSCSKEIHKRNLKQALNHGLIFKKVHKVIKLNQNLDMNTKLRQSKKSFSS